jgi:hypothetical protein
MKLFSHMRSLYTSYTKVRNSSAVMETFVLRHAELEKTSRTSHTPGSQLVEKRLVEKNTASDGNGAFFKQLSTDITGHGENNRI